MDEIIDVPCIILGCFGRVKINGKRSNLADGKTVFIAEPNHQHNCDKCGEAATTKSCVIVLD